MWVWVPKKSDRQKKKYTIYIVLIALRLFSDHINHCLIIGAAGKIANLLDIFYSIIIAWSQLNHYKSLLYIESTFFIVFSSFAFFRIFFLHILTGLQATKKKKQIPSLPRSEKQKKIEPICASGDYIKLVIRQCNCQKSSIKIAENKIQMSHRSE